MILQNFQDFMASHSLSDLPLLIFSSDFFRPYWSQIPGPPISESEVSMIQLAGRIAVTEMMNISDSYWALDNSSERRRKSWDYFLSALKHPSKTFLFRLRAIVLQLAPSTHDEHNFSKLQKLLLALITNEKDFKAVKFDTASMTIIRDAYNTAEIPINDFEELKKPWLESQETWDVRLKNYTYGEPESIWNAINESQHRRTLLPQFLENLWNSIDSEASYLELIDKLQQSFKEALKGKKPLVFPDLPEI